jgi:hypothetical protein
MTVHLYSAAWNEIRMLDFFFRNYEPWVDHFFIFDDGSDDGTYEYLSAKTNVTVEQANRRGLESHIEFQKLLLNEIWKTSRDEADWVVIADIDEHVVHPKIAMRDYLAQQRHLGTTAFPTLGYQMVADGFPDPSCELSQVITRGAPHAAESKLMIFDPKRITETNYSMGGHAAAPTGDVKYPAKSRLRNLHYKMLGPEWLAERYAALDLRRVEIDRAKNWAGHYEMTQGEIDENFSTVNKKAVDFRKPWAPLLHLENRWWDQSLWAKLLRGYQRLLRGCRSILAQ